MLSPIAAPLLAKPGGHRIMPKTTSAVKPTAAIHVATEAPIITPSITISDTTVERKEGDVSDVIEDKENDGAIANVMTETVGEAKRDSTQACSDKKPLLVDINDIEIEMQTNTNNKTAEVHVPQVPLLASIMQVAASVLTGIIDTIEKSDKHVTTTEAKPKDNDGAMANMVEQTVGETKRDSTEASGDKVAIAVDSSDIDINIEMEMQTCTNTTEANGRQEASAVLTNMLDTIVTSDKPVSTTTKAKAKAKESKKDVVDLTRPSE